MRRVLIGLAICTTLATNAAAGDRDLLFSRWETLGTAHGLPTEKVLAVVVDGDLVWAGTEKGLVLVENGKVQALGVEDGLPFPVVTALALDETNGDLWVGTMGGLARLSAGRFDVFDQLNSGLANDVIYGIAVDAGKVWVATAAGLSVFDPGADSWEIYDVTNTLMHEPWTYAVTTREGEVYVAVWGGGVVVKDRETGSFREHRDPDGEMEIDLFRDDGLVHDVTSAIAVADGILWAGTYFGLSRYDGRRWRSYSQKDSGLVGDFINFLRARDGVVWIATDQGLGRFDSQTWHAWRRHEDGTFELQITAADGTSSSRRLAGGPASNTIYGIDVDGADVWLATGRGLTHAVGREPKHRHRP